MFLVSLLTHANNKLNLIVKGLISNNNISSQKLCLTIFQLRSHF